MNTSWKLQDAKAKFSQVVENALKIGPQYVTRRGQEAVVILSVKDYQKITTKKTTLKEFLLSCPKMDDGLSLKDKKIIRGILNFELFIRYLCDIRISQGNAK